MENPMGRFIDPTSDQEMQRRWDAVRAMMREKKIDYLVMQNDEDFMGGSLRWFTDWTALHQFPMTVIFPLHEDMTVIREIRSDEVEKAVDTLDTPAAGLVVDRAVDQKLLDRL